MKIFWLNRTGLVNIKVYYTLFFVSTLFSCATYKPQYGAKAIEPVPDSLQTAKIIHRFYLVGDAGYADGSESQKLLKALHEKLKQEDKNTSLLYLGDNIYPLGMPLPGDKKRAAAEASLNSQLAMAEHFKGKVYFIPGNHDWNSGIKGLKDEEKLVLKALKDKNAFLPDNNCGIDEVKINDNVTLIALDSEWYIEDWDDYPTMNDDCDIKTRAAYFAELESLLNKNQDKTVILALHHPLMSNGAYGGQFSVHKELYPLKYKFPLPVVGSLINLVRRTSGISRQDLQSRVYASQANRIKTLIQGRDNVIVVSGHDHSLQYIEKDNIHQIISGSGSKAEAARAFNDHDFSFGGNGYAVLDVYKNVVSRVTYYKSADNGEEKLFEKVLLQKEDPELKEYPSTFPAYTEATIYPPGTTKKSKFYRFLFGTHYSSYYVLPIHVANVSIDTLYGGLIPGRTGGGHQSNSLRLIDKNNREYVMRGVKKSATRFLQAVAFTTQYVGDDYANTFAEDFLLDFYTTAHPFTPLIIGHLEKSSGIYHTNPKLYFIPKQNALKENNKEFGGELYVVEERPTDEFKDLPSFGKPDGIDGTDDVYANLAKDKKYTIDEKAYIRARLFDLLVGDWDRHSDQWRWSKFKEKDSIYYRPIPRDRDQAFPKYGGALLSILMNMPALRYMKPYKGDIPNVKWQAKQGYTQDVAFITKSGQSVWLEEAIYLKEHLTDAVIDSAFAQLPKEVQDNTMEYIKASLKQRRNNVIKYALKYRDVLLKTVVLTGTNNKDKFVITRMPHGYTKVEIFNSKKDIKTLSFTQTYNHKKTKELWIYGLDDDDVFEVKGKPEKPILIRLIGGQNNDTYAIEDGKRINVYDFKTKENTYQVDKKTLLLLTDDYETNSYDPKKPEYNVLAGYPNIGYNPDDGVKMGAAINYTVNNFNRRPYSQKHSFKADYFFATGGFELIYRGTFMNVASKCNFALDARFTSPNFSINYFGLGNDTKNYDNYQGMNYNRVKLRVFKVAPSFFKQGRNGSFVEVQTPFETLEVDSSHNRFVNQPGNITPYLFEHRQYAGLEGTYRFENYDNASLPALGMQFYATAGWKTSLDLIERNFPHLETGITFIHKILSNNKLVFATTFKGKVLFNNNYEFYQAATLGGDNDLRGYRRQRFAGKSAFYESTDLRYTIGNWKSFIPLKYGILAGYDYGRVWLQNESSEKWHQSVGGGFWVNGVNAVTAKATCFYGSDGARVAVGLLFGL